MNTKETTENVTPLDLDSIDYGGNPESIGIVSVKANTFRMTISGRSILKRTLENERGLSWRYVGYPVSDDFVGLFGPFTLEQYRLGAARLLSGKSDSVEGVPEMLCKALVKEREYNKKNNIK